MSKVLKLGFINSENKNTTLSVPNAKDGLDEAVVRQAMKNITDAHAFNKDGVDPYHSARMAKYVETTTTTLFNDTKSNKD
ncbi:MAG: DUF2922 domain-containing protein [Lactobacillus mulieris]|uniref:DUF2922 domain-containing protein n=1 Tax=Lactobacillus mulieris TaxID=2508708 RepID=A0AAP3GW19_9LACO|nr:DUF2922 domain-containing protein [Lactobacillus mulieris]MCF1783907.1 DUF2922 domain-containing protein [Lactobacillus mulieris]MCT7674325.1 DUF2922 domain-containing protein [Lactobacillus mulieris]MCT7772692.1 DUF2922 domain-containing protein [Lactobacillus mulieris]MCW8104675.1 DUF2922 domain-containing protein [Lactobacillus mulieris]MCZ3844287.1 DUF2922 domain-containing protein [Lactobacillus mulieris]